MNYSISYKKTEYTISAEEKNWSVSWISGSLHHRLHIVGFVPVPTAGYIEVIYLHERIDLTTSKPIPAERHSYQENNWPLFYQAVTALQVGQFCATQCLNGLTRRHSQFDGTPHQQQGIMFFTQAGAIRQPVSFTHLLEKITDLVTSEVSYRLTVSPVDGIGPFTYQIDTLPAVSDAVISLQPREEPYTLKVTDSKGEYRTELIFATPTTVNP